MISVQFCVCLLDNSILMVINYIGSQPVLSAGSKTRHHISIIHILKTKWIVTSSSRPYFNAPPMLERAIKQLSCLCPRRAAKEHSVEPSSNYSALRNLYFWGIINLGPKHMLQHLLYRKSINTQPQPAFITTLTERTLASWIC